MTSRKPKASTLTGAATASSSAPSPDAGTPKSFVIRHGRLITRPLSQLGLDLRQVLAPLTATRLRERKANTIKDYLSVASPLGISHFFMLSQTEANAYLKVARVSNGPACTFTLESFSSIKDVQAFATLPGAGPRRKRSIKPAGVDAYKNSPLLILSGFDLKTSRDKLVVSMLQHAFPALNTKKLSLNALDRAVLFEKQPDGPDGKLRLSFRHYLINTKRPGVSRPIRKLLVAPRGTPSAPVPNLEGCADVADYFAQAQGGAVSSESEPDPDDIIILGQTRRSDPKNSQRAITLAEVGPRMELALVRIQEGFLDGEVLYGEPVAHGDGGSKGNKDKKKRSKPQKKKSAGGKGRRD